MTISSTTVKNSYNGNGSTRTFTYTFKIFNDSDLQVIIRSANGTETIKTLNTHYTVAGAGNANGGSITFLQNLPSYDYTPTASQKIILIRNIPQTQSLDYISNDTFPAESHEEGLDRAIMVVQQLQEEVNRSLKISKTNTMNSTEFSIDAAARAGKILGFDGNGELVVSQELGTYRGNWSTATTFASRDIIKDTVNGNIYFCNTGHTSTGVAPISSNADSAKWDLLIDVSQATTAATNSANSATSAATAAASALTYRNAAQAAQAAAENIYDLFDDRFLGAKATDPVLDNDGNALQDGVFYWDTTNKVLKVYDLTNTAWRRTAPTNANQANIDIVSTPTNIANIASVANIANQISSVQTKLSEIQTVANDLTEQVSEIDTVAQHVQTIDAVGNSITNVNTVAANLAGINSFNERYRISATQPTTSLDVGDLWYDSSNSQLKVYTANGWEVSSAYLENLVNDYTYNITGSPSYVQGASNNANSAAFYYTVDSLVNVFVNGIRLIPTADYQLSNNNRVTFTNALVNGDVVYIQVFTKLTVAQEQLLDAKVTAAQTAQTASETARNNSQTYSVNSANSATASANSATASATSASNAATSASAANTSATNAASSATSALNSLNSFLDTYSYGVTAPNNPTTGDLWFDSANTRLKIYINGSWQQAGAYLEGLINIYTFNCTQGQTTFSGADINNNTLSFGGTTNCIVYLNGIRLVPTLDYTYGVNSLTLGVAANNGDVLFVEVITKLQLAEEQTIQGYVSTTLGYKNTTEGFKNTTEGYKNAAQTSATNAANSATASANSATASQNSATASAASAASSLQSLNSFNAAYTYSSTPPANPDNGAIWFDTATTRLKVYVALNNTGWVNVGTYVEGLITNYTYIATAGQTVFNGADTSSPTKTLSFNATGNVFVFVNGIRITPISDYVLSAGNTCTLTVAANAGDVIYIEVIQKISLTEEQLLQSYVASALADKNTATTQAGIATTQAGISTTKASEASASAAAALTSKNNAATSEANALSYRNTTETYKNNAASSASAAAASAALATVGGGSFKITANDTTANVFNQKVNVGNGITKTLNNAGGNETVTLSLPFTETVITPTDGQTVFTLNYTVGFIQVFVNGVKLINGTDFTATNGTTIVLSTGLLSNDIVDIVKYS